MVKEFIHRPIGQEITAIGGHYVITDEIRWPFEDKEVLYLKGYALVDTSCCGISGCPFIHVQGYLNKWKANRNSEGLEISYLEPIADERKKKKIHKLLQEKEVFHEIRFD